MKVAGILGSTTVGTLTSLLTLNIRGNGIPSAENVGNASAGASINGDWHVLFRKG